MTQNNCYEDLDSLFKKLYEKYGLDNDIIEVKQSVIKIIDNIINYEYKINDIAKDLKKRNYRINEFGIIISS